MAEQSGRSSRELSATASEYALKAQEDDELEQELAAQILTLQKQQEAARLRREEHRRNEKVNKQAARDSQFIEQSIERRNSYGGLMPDHKDHVARAIRRSQHYENHVEYLQDLASQKVQNFDTLMALLYEEYFGQNDDVLIDITQRITTCDPGITDEILEEYQKSWSSQTGLETSANTRVTLHAPPETCKVLKTPADSASSKDATTAVPVENEPPLTQKVTQQWTAVNSDLVPGQEPQASIECVSPIKTEKAQPPASPAVAHHRMSVIEHSGTEGTDGASNRHSTGSDYVLTIEIPKKKDKSSPALSPPAKSRPRGRPSAATPSKKRSKKDQSPESTAPTPTPSKKAKKNKDPNELTALVKRYVDRIEKRVADGNPVARDLTCSKCEKPANDPRVSACLHLYCNSCLGDICKDNGATGAKNRAHVECSRSTCKKTVGRPGVVPIDIVQQLRKKYIDSPLQHENGDEDEEMQDDDEDNNSLKSTAEDALHALDGNDGAGDIEGNADIDDVDNIEEE